MNRSTRLWVVLSLMVGTAIVTLAVLKRGNEGEREPPHRGAVETNREHREPAAEDFEAAVASLSCGQALDIVRGDNVERLCMGALVTKHNGSVRSHQIATLSAPQRWLRVEMAGSAILSAAWGGESRPEFQCQAAECNGIVIGRRDAQGVRVMTLERTSLMPTSPGDASAAAVLLSGRFEIAPEQLSGLACDDQGVSIVTSDSSSQMFCPRGGAGFEIGNDGTRRYRFTSLDGESIVVATGRDQQVERVQYEGEVSLACQSVECGSVRISAADSEGARRFTFAGATLIETDSGQSNAVLNGTLLLPPL